MFKLKDSIPFINQLWFDSAVLQEADSATQATNLALLQKGGFIYLTAATTQGGQKIARMAVPTATIEIGASDFQKTRLVYPIFITREQDADFSPLKTNGILTFINGTTHYEGWVNSDSYYQNGSTYPTIAAGEPMALKPNPDSSGRSKLCVLTNTEKASAKSLKKVVAYAMSAVVDGEVKIRWVA